MACHKMRTNSFKRKNIDKRDILTFQNVTGAAGHAWGEVRIIAEETSAKVVLSHCSHKKT